MFPSLNSSISLADKILFYESISNLLEGGITLLASFKGLLSRTHPGALHDTLENTIFFIESGDSLNIAMRKFPDFYTQKEIAIVESGEQTGMLKDAFMAIASELRMQEDLRRKVIGALTYPLVIMFFLVLALTVVMMYVVPQIMPIIAEMTTEISLSTRSLIWVSNFLRHNIVFIIIVLIALVLIFRGYTVTDIGKRWLDRVKLYTPITGTIYKNYIVVQVMSTFHLLSSSGVSIVKALRLTGASAGNSTIADMYSYIADEVSKGKKISEAMFEVDKEGYVFSSDIIQMIESAEKTSTVHQISKKIAEQYRREVDASLAVMVKLIEPIALLMAGVFVMWFAIAIFSSIMQVVGVAGN
ncbi:type II secretion system F family protein [Candidatus Gracilibacteria bacterium]|nr:type II secretion system F family protein [Candidatus Gracilibacteria bacterium]